jgi:hypothetical protein
MILETHDNLGNPSREKSSRVVVYDNYNNPIACFLQINPTTIDYRHRGQPGFEEALKYLGIKQTCFTKKVKKDGLKLVKQ